MRAVNLLPRDDGRQKTKRSTNKAALVGIVGGSIVLTGLASMTLMANGSVSQKQEELEALNVQLAVTPKPPAPPSPIESGLVDQRTARVTALSTALSKRVSWDRVLRRFSLVLPDDVWLTNLEARSPHGDGAAAAAPTTAATGFTITGFTYSHDAVARLLSRLEVLPDLTSVQLQSSARTPLGGRKVVTFTIIANVKTAAVTS